MKILFLESGPIWSRGLTDGLRDLGHNVKISGPLTKKKIASLISSYKPQLLMTVGWGPEQTKEKQRWMRQYASISGIPLIYWSTEDPNFTAEFTLPLIRRMKPDFVFTISARTAAYYRKLGIRAAHLDFGFSPSIHRRVKPLQKYRHKIAVVANAYPQVLSRYPKHFRRKALNLLIRPLLSAGIRVDFYGADWEKMKPYLGKTVPRGWIHGKLPYQNANQVYSSSQIMLGLQNYRDMVTQRTYEILGSGGFLLTIDTPGVRRVGKPGRDFAVSTSPEDTVRLVHHYLEHPSARERIRRQGNRTVYRHNYTNRAKRMLSILRRTGLLK
ncbi:glycosyltransferase [Paenibacillus sp. 32352]|uniref:CgeB family protein n=1 Tax=Paenibacillus sp. 32352 TaxID=1969111 RepID=UPI0009AE9637|nr:glycosyltransferase [Paenibacillus sp. 32352]